MKLESLTDSCSCSLKYLIQFLFKTCFFIQVTWTRRRTSYTESHEFFLSDKFYFDTEK